MKKANLLSIEDIRSQFEFDSETGSLYRLHLRASNMRAKTGSETKGGLIVGVNGTHEYAHRIVWALVHGEWPSKQIEHVNGNKFDNRTENLRLRTPSEKPEFTTDRVKSVLNYDRETGRFYWKISNKGTIAGSEAGSTNVHGYRTITIDGKAQYAHRLAIVFETSEWPKHQVDHINGVRDDNRIENLRDVTPSRNAHNTSKLGNKNKTGFRGVARFGGKYIPQIMVDGVIEAIGDKMFDTAKEAAIVYEARRLELFGEAPQKCDKVYYRKSRSKKEN